MTVWPAELAGQVPAELFASSAVPTAAPSGQPGGGRGEEFGKSTPVALLVIVLLAISVVLLIRSMTKHLKKVPASFDEPPASDGERGADSPAKAVETTETKE